MKSMEKRLEGKIAIVTGAAGGIGREICEKFASEKAIVVLVDINQAKLKAFFKSFSEKHGSQHLEVCGDASSASFAETCFASVLKKYGKPGDILVNCAGGSPICLFMDMTEKMFDDIVNLNLKTVFLMTKAFATSLKTENGMQNASIINIASMAGKVATPKLRAYSASKGGIISLTKTVGAELGEYGIRCNAVLPGLIMTKLTENVSEKHQELVCQVTPLKKLGVPADVANVCLFLASDESSHISCNCFEVAGGYMA